MSEFVKKLYAWCLNKVRFVAGSIRAFLPRVLPGKKKSIAFLKRVFFLSAVLLLACPVIMRTGGSMSTGLPVFSTTATYTLLDDGDGNWRIKFLSSGTVSFSKTITVDLFLVGGGGGGAGSASGYGGGGGGGGGYTETYSSIVLQKDTTYSIVIGSGGAGGVYNHTAGTGGKSWAFTESLYYANGGYGGIDDNIVAAVHGGAGGSGGGDRTGDGGSDGSDGGSDPSYANYAAGQGTTTREFGETGAALYAGGGGGIYHYQLGGDGGGADTGYAGDPNTGGGGSGPKYDGTTQTGFIGGSGICVIRNHREAA